MSVADRLLSMLVDATGPAPTRLAVAVSGGGDSLALLHLACDWRARGGPEVAAVTVDHGLRPEAADEAREVGRRCAGLAIRHATLHWRDVPASNTMALARAARYRLIGRWAREEGLQTVLLGHTRDDVAETFLMRLARGSGVDGLSAMSARRQAEGVLWLRPLLSATRDDLRAYLSGRGIGWIDDPTNDDAAFLRTRARAALRALASLGIDAGKLAGTAARMSRARLALEAATGDLAVRTVTFDAGDVCLDRAALSSAPDEIALRLLAWAIDHVAPADYRPRLAGLERTLKAIREGRRTTIAGTLALQAGSRARIVREPRAAAIAPPARPGEVWDGRWILAGGEGEVRALGAAGLALLPGARATTGLPRATLLASPALWQDGRLAAAPLAGFPGGIRLIPAREPAAFGRPFATH